MRVATRGNREVVGGRRVQAVGLENKIDVVRLQFNLPGADKLEGAWGGGERA
jgi:hypothetical protein